MLALLIAAQMAAATPAPACPATPTAATGELAGWGSATSVAASGKPGGMASIPLGARADLGLVPSATFQPAASPNKPAAPDTYSGLVGFTIAKAGTYRVALGAAAWVDVLDAQNRPQLSTAHGHGPDCTGIRKIVDFTLTPGSYRLQISGNFKPSLAAMVVAKP